MSNILYLVHRFPYPPNKGDKVRSYHILRHLAQRHRIYLGTFIDDPEDAVHLDTVRGWCADVYAAPLSPRLARLRSARGLATGTALTLPYYRDVRLQDWVERVCATGVIDAAVIFSSAMAQYVEHRPGLPLLVDFVDVDSAKWTQYGQTRLWPLSWLFRREGMCLLNYERRTAARARRSFFVTAQEADLFCRQAPEAAGRVEALNNGVDGEFFSPAPVFDNPFAGDEDAVVFTGAMDYWPNVDAVTWFAQEVLPLLRSRHPRVRFYVVGRSPAPAVRQLAGVTVTVTGTVADVRPYLRHAAVVVAPLRIARGIQNKVLEAMAMGCAVVVSRSCAAAIDAQEGEHLVSAGTADEFAGAVTKFLDDREAAGACGRAARRQVLQRYGWEANLAGLERHIEAAIGGYPASPPGVGA